MVLGCQEGVWTQQGGLSWVATGMWQEAAGRGPMLRPFGCYLLGPTGIVTCEEPNSRMHDFVGSLEWNSRKYPLDIGNLLLRGCKIRNTDTCYGLVIYAGTAHGPLDWGTEGES